MKKIIFLFSKIEYTIQLSLAVLLSSEAREIKALFYFQASADNTGYSLYYDEKNRITFDFVSYFGCFLFFLAVREEKF